MWISSFGWGSECKLRASSLSQDNGSSLAEQSDARGVTRGPITSIDAGAVARRHINCVDNILYADWDAVERSLRNPCITIMSLGKGSINVHIFPRFHDLLARLDA